MFFSGEFFRLFFSGRLFFAVVFFPVVFVSRCFFFQAFVFPGGVCIYLVFFARFVHEVAPFSSRSG